MAHLWRQTADQAEWRAEPVVDGERVGVCELFQYADGLTGRERWALLARRGPGVRVNGAELRSGLRSLRDRDAIEVDGALLFFSTERAVAVVALPADEAGIECARCRTVMVVGRPAVRCPRCSRWHHAAAELPCWGSLPRCASCDRQTAVDGYSWTPCGL